jgi:hypothetical protein
LIKHRLLGADFDADSEYHVYFAWKLSFGSRNLEIRVKIRNFADISLFSTWCRPLFINPMTYLNRAWKTASNYHSLTWVQRCSVDHNHWKEGWPCWSYSYFAIINSWAF